jgi:two-component system chemotaxis sensor kinase CheA
MDVVRTNIERIGGTADVFNRPVHGTTVRIRIPLTLAIIPGLVVMLRGDEGKKEQRFVISRSSLVELVRLEGAAQIKRIELVHGTPVYRHRGKLLPLIYLSHVFGRTELDTSDIVNIVLLKADDRQLGLVVDEICDTQEIVVKPLSKQLRGLSCYMGATIMGDGKIALILDVPGLARLAGLVPQSRHLAGVKEKTATTETAADAKQRLLLFRVGGLERVAAPLAAVARLEKFDRGKVEYASGLPVIHYRSQIMPLVSLDRRVEARSFLSDELHVIVFAHVQKSIGLVVDRIEDIVEETVTGKRVSAAKGLLESAIVGGKVTDLIDLHTIVKICKSDGLSGTEEETKEGPRVLLVDASTTVRALGSYLEMAGYEACDAAGAVVETQPVDAIVSGLKSQGFTTWVARDDRDALLEALDAAIAVSSESCALTGIAGAAK